MPELPEVQTVVNTLQAHVLGRIIAKAELVRTDILTPPGTPLPALLSHRQITQVHRRGKKIVFNLDDGNRFYIHLGMTGRLTVDNPATPPPRHTHLILHLSPPPLSHDSLSHGLLSHGFLSPRSHPSHLSHPVLRFSDSRRFGGIWWLGKDLPIDADLGPEPLTLRPAQLARLLSKTTRSIKTALLDQKLLAGLGNIYADEALHTAGIHPTTPANRLDSAQISRLCRSIKQVLRRAIRHKGSTLRDYRTADGDEGNFQHLHRVYAREALPCHTCKTPIKRIVLGGRSTHYCPSCQPEGQRR